MFSGTDAAALTSLLTTLLRDAIAGDSGRCWLFRMTLGGVDLASTIRQTRAGPNIHEFDSGHLRAHPRVDDEQSAREGDTFCNIPAVILHISHSSPLAASTT